MEWTRVSKRPPPINKQLLIIPIVSQRAQFAMALKPCERNSTKYHPAYLVWHGLEQFGDLPKPCSTASWIEMQDNDLWIELPELPKK